MAFDLDLIWLLVFPVVASLVLASMAEGLLGLVIDWLRGLLNL